MARNYKHIYEQPQPGTGPQNIPLSQPGVRDSTSQRRGRKGGGILDRMIDNLTLKLDEIDAATLGTPITMNEVREVLRKVPRAKTPGPNAFTDGMADHHIRANTPMIPLLGQGVADGKDRRLRQ